MIVALTKDTLNLVDALLERVRAEVLSGIAFGGEVTGTIDIRGDTTVDDKIIQYLQPAVEAVSIALKIAHFARDTEGIVNRLFWEGMLYYPGEVDEVFMAEYSDIRQVWRPLPPGPEYKIEFLPPESVEVPEPLGGDKGPVQ